MLYQLVASQGGRFILLGGGQQSSANLFKFNTPTSLSLLQLAPEEFLLGLKSSREVLVLLRQLFHALAHALHGIRPLFKLSLVTL